MKTKTMTCLVAFTLGISASLPAHADAPDYSGEYEKLQMRYFLQNAWEAVDAGMSRPALGRLRLFASRYEAAPLPKLDDRDTQDPHDRRNPRALMRQDFFAWRYLFATAHALAIRNELPATLRDNLRAIARENVRPRERGPNNRSFHFALAAIYAAELFPDANEAPVWRAYAESVWNDWLTPGDAYEPGYVAHWFPQLIELGQALGHDDLLRGDKARAMYARLRDHISPGGLAVAPGDPGGPADQADYVEGLARAASVTNDGALLAAARRALAASANDKRHARLARIVQEVAEKISTSGVRAEPARTIAEVQYLFPKSYNVADRVILSSPQTPSRPYAALYANDRTETLYHGHEDNRGEVYHYENDGALLLKRSGWIKWAGCANTFVVADETAQFPFTTTRGITPRRWLTGSANIAQVRDYVEGEGWARKGGEPVEYAQRAFSDTITGLGYSWNNPAGWAGAHDVIGLRDITLRFLAIPPAEMHAASLAGSHSLNTLSFDPGMAWYREYRAVAPAEQDGTLEFLVANLRLAGPDVCNEIAHFDVIPENMRVVHYAPGTKGENGRIVPREEWGKWLAIKNHSNGQNPKALHIKCPPGRLDLVLPMEKNMRVNIAKTTPRVEIDYQVLTPDATLLRLPMAVAINGIRPRSVYLDGQQGGRLVSAKAEERDGDRCGSLAYEGVYAADASWTRRIVLLREGIMIAVDDYIAGERQHGATGGPVWQLASTPTFAARKSAIGMNWFSSPSFNRPDKSLLVWFHPQAGVEFGMQYQQKLFDERECAVYARTILPPHTKKCLVTVLIPHDTSLPASEIVGAPDNNMRLLGAKPERAGIQTAVDAAGNVTVRIAPKTKTRPWPYKPVSVTVRADGTWEVVR